MDSATTHPPPDGAGALPEARGKRSRWLGLVWAVPLAALIIVAFLGIRSLAHRGVDVVVTFDNATGVKVGDTKVIYQGLVGGEVTKIEINEDGKHVDMTLRLDQRVKPYLNTATRFWLVGAKPNLTDIASVRAALAGLEIGVSPGTGGTPTTRFVGENEPPAIAPGTPGTPYSLTTGTLGAARVGTLLFYRGQEIGKVTAVGYTEQNIFRIDLFVNAPFDKLVRPEALFWVSSPLRVLFTDRGLSADLEHPSALLNGSIDVDLPGDRLTGTQARPPPSSRCTRAATAPEPGRPGRRSATPFVSPAPQAIFHPEHRCVSSASRSASSDRCSSSSTMPPAWLTRKSSRPSTRPS